jgi:hypothetical protein
LDGPTKTFLKELIGLHSCYNKRNGHYLHCTCVKDIVDLDRAVDYIANVATIAKKEQDALFKELINSRHHHSAGYNLRSGINKSHGYRFELCLNSFLNLIAVGNKRFKSLNETRHIPGENKHNNTGNGNACMSNEALQSVVDFIKLKGKQDGEAYATRVIHTLTKKSFAMKRRAPWNYPLTQQRGSFTKSIALIEGGLSSQITWAATRR